MVSNVEMGRRFQEVCRKELTNATGRNFDLEVYITTPNGRTHAFDLATREKDIVVECKAFGWTVSGNTPSAKITHLREALQDLALLPSGTTCYLVVKKALHPSRQETLGEYFVRLNKPILGSANILELSENGGDLFCLHGSLTRLSIDPPSSTDSQPYMASNDLGALRRSMFKILDFLEGKRTREEGPAKRVSRLRSEGKLDRNVANLMHTVLGFRDSAEYDDHVLTTSEDAAIRNAWKAITEWAHLKGWQY